MKGKELKDTFVELLKGNFSEDVEKELLAAIEEDAELKKEFEAYRRVFEATQAVAKQPHSVGPAFSVQVMDRIEERDNRFFKEVRRMFRLFGWFLAPSSMSSFVLLVALVCVVTVGSVTFLGSQASETFSHVGQHMQSGGSGGFFEPQFDSAPVPRRQRSPRRWSWSLSDNASGPTSPSAATAPRMEKSPAGRDLRTIEENVLRAPVETERGEITQPSRYGKSERRRPFEEPPRTAEVYGHYQENPHHFVSQNPISTFSIDVDTGSYTNMRRFLRNGKLPPAQAVRIEELINYFTYDYPRQTEQPFGVHYEMAPSPLESDRYLLKVGIRAQDASLDEEIGWNLVFLIDVSGSMAAENKLPLLKRSMRVLVDGMRPVDRVAIVTYSGAAQTVLPSTPGRDKHSILSAISSLRSGGSTNGSAGIDMAYRIAQRHFIQGGVNRVILATDGDFNVGTYSFDGLMRLIEQKRRTGISLTTLGFGVGNYKEKNLEQLADKGNGNYFYVDSFDEARRVLREKLVSSIQTVAKDVKLQIEFNPQHVATYRLIGYDNRRLRTQDFSNDRVDAGEIGAGHTVTVLYEIVLTGSPLAGRLEEELRYQKPKEAPQLETSSNHTEELAFLKIRYKEPTASRSNLLTYPILRSAMLEEKETSDDFRFAAAVSYFGHLLRESRYAGQYSHRDIAALAKKAKGEDPNGERQEFIGLVENAAVAGY